MNITTAWIEPPTAIAGRDHLAVQVPCLGIYSRLLPGITNVTDRARYYTLYPWFIWSFDRFVEPRTRENFIRLFRRADCLLTLIAERHAQCLGERPERHGAAMAGRQKLVPALQRLVANDEDLQLSIYATTEKSDRRYFQNTLGGLGQYYQGPLFDLCVLAESKNGILRYTHEHGERLAKAVDATIDREAFFQALEQDRISLKTLDALAMFCPCQLPHCPDEHAALGDLFFDRSGHFEESGRQRRSSLALLLHLIKQLEGKQYSLDRPTFFACAYSGHLPDGRVWTSPAELETTRLGWALYQRNELFSLALQGIFQATLTTLRDHPPATRPASGHDLAQWFTTTTIAGIALAGRHGHDFGSEVAAVRDRLPPLADWQNPRHECQLGQVLVNGKQDGQVVSQADILRKSLDVLLALIARGGSSHEPYQGFEFSAAYLQDYPLNLVALRHHSEHTWTGMTLESWLAWLVCHWGVEAHLRVGLRKLRYQGQDTFRLRPTEHDGLVVVDVPPVADTAPRFHQALQVLFDLAAVVHDEHRRYRLTDLGRQLLSETCGD